MKAIRLIQKDPKLAPWPKDFAANLYSSGYWHLTAKRAEEAIGTDIYFHHTRTSPSFFGGRITAFSTQPDSPYAGRIIFDLTADVSYKGQKTTNDGWRMEMKFE